MSGERCGNTPRWVARVNALSGVNAEDNLRVPPRSQDGLELKDYSDNEAVRSRGQDLVYAIPGTKYF